MALTQLNLEDKTINTEADKENGSNTTKKKHETNVIGNAADVDKGEISSDDGAPQKARVPYSEMCKLVKGGKRDIYEALRYEGKVLKPYICVFDVQI